MQAMEGPALFALAVPLWLMARRAAGGGGPNRPTTGTGSSRDRECPEVQAVLSYWFDGDSSHNYKFKWFPSSSKDIQRKADLAIQEKFGQYLQDGTSGSWSHWGRSLNATLAKIIVLDQFSRHIYRDLPADAKERKSADAMALVLAEGLVNIANWQHGMSTPEFVFALMPFRHSSTLERLEVVLGLISKRRDTVGHSDELLSKFQKQTLRRYQALQDKAKADAAGDIVDHHYFATDETNILSDPLVTTVQSFLLKHLKATPHGAKPIPLAISLSGGVDSMVIAKILAVLRDHGLIGLGAGAGGGISRRDKTADDSNLHPVVVVAMHIDYGNRPESVEEARFVHWYATDILRFEWRLRQITEVTRGVTERSDYEKVSRSIRYSFYKEILAEMSCQGVIFGHHIGDVQENVISNVMRGSSSLYLSGMSDVGVTEGVSVWRPLLVHNKDDIYRFAHKYGVPYLQDTTPSWSTRGKLRNSLLPLLMDIYGTGCLHNLSSLASDSDAMRELVQGTVFGPFMNSVCRFSCGVAVEITDGYRDQSAVFWAEALKQMMHSMGMSLVREKAVQNFVGRINMQAKAEQQVAILPGRHVSFQMDSTPYRIMSGWIELRKGFNCYIDGNNTLCILRQGVLRPSGSASRPSRGSRPRDKSDGAEAGKTAPCVAVSVTGGNPTILVQVVSTGNNGVGVELREEYGGEQQSVVRITSTAELRSPLQSTLLDVSVCLTAMTALDLAYPLSPRQTRPYSEPKNKESISFSLEFGFWKIVVCLTPSANTSFNIRSTSTSQFASIRASSPDSFALSDGDQSDIEDDSVWKWSPGERVDMRPASPQELSRYPDRYPPLHDIHDILRGNFSYEFPIYHHNCKPENSGHRVNASDTVAAVIPLRLCAGMKASGLREHNLSSLKNLDEKIREGLPLMCPVNVLLDDCAASDKKLKNTGNKSDVTVDRVCSVYVSYLYSEKS